MEPAMLKVERISKRLGGFRIRDLSFEVQAGEYFVLLGESGTGKTVLLDILTGITMPDEGRILLDGRDITREKIQKRGIGLVFQDHALFPHMSVEKNIAYGLKGGKGRTESSGKIRKLAEEMEITHLLGRSPGNLSGGEAQRVALARTLATGPDCLLLDEPLSSLDTGARAKVRSLLRRLNRRGVTMIHVTHDYQEAISLASRIAVMEGGTIVQVDTPGRIFQHPRSEFVARFTGIRNFIRGRLRRDAGGSPDQAVFETNGLSLCVLSDLGEGETFAVIRSEDVTISIERPSTSARNVLAGRITDICPVRLGVEVIVDAGVEIASVVTGRSVEDLALEPGKEVYLSVKASAIKVLEA